ncbi:hypothetical protein BS50DRAFT_579366 [Corynespora cassiicola Philippines]|uniref:Uncharacterized protein n=1 Tax=Corynespora cassiicola Philippines TaxID=1448308 RepID=A0A2T2N4N5_CORCC|nr:hypothetical protein BS50DRAFT_579366 [Corynespora cassiicola Philippines]
MFNSTIVRPALTVPSTLPLVTCQPCATQRPASTPVVAVPTLVLSKTEESHADLSLTIVFGVVGLVVAIIGTAIAVLQLRHMYNRHKLSKELHWIS